MGIMMDSRQATSHTAPLHSQVFTDLTASQIFETFLSYDRHRDGSRVSAETAPVSSPRCCPENCTLGRDEIFDHRSVQGKIQGDLVLLTWPRHSLNSRTSTYSSWIRAGAQLSTSPQAIFQHSIARCW